MLKTIKTTKQMRLDELVKYIFENDIKSTIYVSDSDEVRVTANWDGAVEIKRLDFGTCVHQREVFTVEIEEPITEDTEFDELVCVYKGETLIKVHKSSINGIFKSNLEDEVNEIYALINGKLELVCERDQDE